MTPSFTDRTMPILTQKGLDALAGQTIAISGLGGVGGGAFLALVRCGAAKFRLAENGVFDPPDMNRQAGAFGTTMDRPKLDVYVELARSINPDIELELYPDGITPDNLAGFLEGVDAYAGVIDVERGAEVKAMTAELLERFSVPMFTCGAIGFGALLVAHKPGGMMPEEFWKLVAEKSTSGGLLPSYMAARFNKGVIARFNQGMAEGILPTTPIGGMTSNVLLATEIICYLLRDTGLVDREAVFAPGFTTVDFLEQRMETSDVTVD